eukprot:gb/GFBE01054930.1/.p1 GENE.gb/GFBE01054930.1/~~gb/GFBE01054930.1/.p1  ORF type:complete len:933 (+),score=141.91 gb/GFBE01054930.1/:1-2799(+)
MRVAALNLLIGIALVQSLAAIDSGDAGRSHQLHIGSRGELQQLSDSNHSHVRRNALLRREEAQSAHVLDTMPSLPKQQRPQIDFEPSLKTCDMAKADAFYNSHRKTIGSQTPEAARRSSSMRALVEVKHIFDELGVPIVLLGGLSLGYIESCMALPGDMDSSVATFGPWLQNVGMVTIEQTFAAKGHTFDLSLCEAGPLSAGCVISITLYGVPWSERKSVGNPFIDVHVLFFAPLPSGAARWPGVFSQCDVESCGATCASCSLAYARWQGDAAEQGRFYACPLPVRSFSLVAWMNETFWVPADPELYFKAEYLQKGSDPASWSPYKACEASTTAQVSLEPYEAFIPNLPSASQVFQDQRALEYDEASRIREAAMYDVSLWQKYFPLHATSFSQSLWAFPVSEEATTRSPVHSLPFSSTYSAAVLEENCWVITILLSIAPSLVISQRIGKASGSGIGRGSFSLWRASHVAAFVAHLVLSITRAFLQHLAGGTGYALLAACVLAYWGKLSWAAGKVHLSGRLSFPPGGLSRPVLLAASPGACLAIGDWFSCISLLTLDPASYVLVVQVRIVLGAVVWRLASFGYSNIQWLALSVLGAAVTIKAFNPDSDRVDLPQGVCAALFQVALVILASALSNASVGVQLQRDVMNMYAHIAGLAALLVLFACTAPLWPLHDPFFVIREAFWQLSQNPWLLTSVVCMIFIGILETDLLPVQSDVADEIGSGCIISVTSLLQWWVLQWEGGATDVQALILAMLALGTYFAEPTRMRCKASGRQQNADAAVPEPCKAAKDRPLPEGMAASTCLPRAVGLCFSKATQIWWFRRSMAAETADPHARSAHGYRARRPPPQPKAPVRRAAGKFQLLLADGAADAGESEVTTSAPASPRSGSAESEATAATDKQSAVQELVKRWNTYSFGMSATKRNSDISDHAPTQAM